MISKKAASQSAIPSNIGFSAESNVIYFLDRDNARLYRYNTQGRLTREYIIKELGKDLESK
jgi:sugar lactone lactonase YvrE